MAKEPKVVERTAKSPFKLAGRDVVAGQIVSVTQEQLKKLAAADCVELDDDANAEVPVRGLPPTQGSIVPPPPKPEDFQSKTDDELRKIAADRKVDISNLKTRDDVIAALQLHAETVLTQKDVVK